MKYAHLPFKLIFLLAFLFSTQEVAAQMSGSYLIDPNGTGDYSTLSAAVTDLNSSGMTGEVILQLKSGIYNEKVILDAVSGNSADNQIIIESFSGNLEDVVISFLTNESDTSNYVIRLNKTSGVTIRNITFDNEDANSSYGRIIELTGNVSNTTLEGNHFIGNRNSSAILFGYGAGGNDYFFNERDTIKNLTVRQNVFNYFSPAVSASYSYTQDIYHENLVIDSNTFIDSDGVGVASVNGVHVSNNLNYGILYKVQPITLQSCGGAIVIEKNIAYRTLKGIDMSSISGTKETPAIIRNNFFSGKSKLLALNTINHVNVANNTFTGTIDNDNILNFFSVDSLNMFNNIFYQQSDGVVMFYYDLGKIESDNNCYYAPEGAFGLSAEDYYDTLKTLDDFQNRLDAEHHSLSIDPNITSDTTYRALASGLIDAGQALDYVTEDIEGDPRNDGKPDIGADEESKISNLVITAIESESTVINVDEGLTVTWRGKNVGETTFEGPWKDEVYLSTDTQWDENDELLGFKINSEILDPSEAFDFSKTFLVDIQQPGEYYILVKINSEGDLLEDNSDNILAGPRLTVNFKDRPNLIVSSISLPDKINSGSVITFEWTVTNNGDRPTTEKWNDYIYFSSDSLLLADLENLDPQKALVTKIENPLGLEPGESYTNSHHFKLALRGSGKYYVRVITDLEDTQSELNESLFDNSTIGQPVSVTQSPLADLVITSFNFPETAFSGEPITFSYTIKNVGSDKTSYDLWSDYIYVTKDSIPDRNTFRSDWKKRKQIKHWKELEKEEELVVQETISLPYCEADTFYLHLLLDLQDEIVEISEDNNIVSGTHSLVAVQKPNADFVIERLDFLSDDFETEKYVRLEYDVYNRGFDKASIFNNLSEGIYLSKDEIFDPEKDVKVTYGIFLDTMFFEIDQKLTRQQTLRFPDSLYGDYYVVVNADEYDAFCEVPYEDNNAFFSNRINIKLAPIKDLTIEDLNIETSGVAGEQMTLEYKLFNRGEGTILKPNVIDSLFLVPENGEPLEENYIWYVKRDLNLTAAASTQEDLYFKIPIKLKPGNYRLVIKTDAANNVYEHEAENNNQIASEIIEITRDDNKMADLNIDDINIPDEINSGEVITLKPTIRNLSNARTNTDEWKYRVQLLNDKKKVIKSKSYNQFGFLDGNSAVEREVEFEVPNGISGNFQLVFHEDVNYKVFEYYKQNNADTINIEIQLSPWADLIPKNFVYKDSITAGQLADMSWEILNQGEGNTKAGLIINKVYVSKDNLLDKEDVLLTKEPIESVVQSHSIVSQSINFRVNPDLEGLYYLILVADEGNQEYEHTDENNNIVTSAEEIYIIHPKPVDFTPWPASIDLFSNSQIVTYSVYNGGPNVAYGSWVDAAFLSTDEVWDKDDIFLGYQTINFGEAGLPAGESYNGRIRSEAGFVKTDDYYVIIKSDVYHFIPEVNTGNNNRASSNTFYVDLIEELIPGETKDSIFYQHRDRTHYYKMHTRTDKGYLLSFDGKNSNNRTELYYKIGDVPNRGGNFDFKGANNFQEFQQIIIPSKDSVTTDYTMAYADYIFGETMNYTLLAEEKEFSIVNITPEYGGNEGIIVMDINGFDFSDSLRAYIRNDVDSMVAVHSYALSSIKARAHFNLNEVVPGTYDVVLQRLDRGDETVLEQQFTVQDTSYTDYYMTVTGPDRVRIGRDFIGQLNFANNGNINDYDVLMLCAFYLDNHSPEDFSIDYLGDGISDDLPPELQPLHPFTNETLIHDDKAYYFFTWMPVFAAQSSGQYTFKFNIDLFDTLNISAQFFANPISKIHFTGNLNDLLQTAFMKELDSIFSNGASTTSNARLMDDECIDDPEVVEAMIWKGVRAQAEYVAGGIPSGRTDVVVTLIQEGLKSLVDPEAHNHAQGVAQDLVDENREIVLNPTKKSPYDHLIKNLDNCLKQNPDLIKEIRDKCITAHRKPRANGTGFTTVYTNNCIKKPPPGGNGGGGGGGSNKGIPIVKSLDPNEILGPEGKGDPRYITSEDELEYRINFENVADASAAAQRVAIDNKLEDGFNERTFRLKEIGYNDTTIQLPNSAFFSGSFDLGPGYDNYQLQLTAGIDPVNRQVFWRFQTIDPATGAPPSDPDGGFLPPNDSTGIGEGYVSYTIYARNGLSGGTELKNKAAIVFDQEKRLDTNEWINTIQGDGLDSYVNNLPAQMDSTRFVVSWQPNEVFNGFQPDITAYSIYVSDNDSSYYIWQQNTQETEAVFTGKRGHYYEFFSIGQTSGGVQEYAPAVADAATFVSDDAGQITGLDEEVVTKLLKGKNLVVYPNPSSGDLNMAYKLKYSGKLTLTVTNVLGRKVTALELGYKEAGIHDMYLTNLSGLPDGLYILKIEGKGVKETTKWLKY